MEFLYPRLFKKERFKLGSFIIGLIFTFLFIFLNILNIKSAKAKIVPIPTVINPYQMEKFTTAEPIIKGLTINNSTVLIFIDNKFNGFAKVVNGKERTASFAYKPFLPLKQGKHTLQIKAKIKDKNETKKSVLSNKINFEIMALPAPILIKPTEIKTTRKPIITGLVKNGLDVLVYIDGVYNGKIKPKKQKSGTANFAYLPFLNLAYGKHQVWTVSKDRKKRKSIKSNVLCFNIEHPYPAPIIKKPVVNKLSSYDRPFIVGLIKNNSKVVLYLDNSSKSLANFIVPNHKSGTTNFYCRTFHLSPGWHIIKAQAIDIKTNKASKLSSYRFKIKNPKIAQGIYEEKEKIINNKTNNQKKKSLNKTNSNGELESTNVNKKNQNKKNNSNKLILSYFNKNKLILLAFIIFSLSLIAWIIIINKDLSKKND